MALSQIENFPGLNPPKSYDKLFVSRDDIAIRASYSINYISEINISLLPFLTPEQVEELIKQILLCKKHLAKQLSLDKAENHTGQIKYIQSYVDMGDNYLNIIKTHYKIATENPEEYKFQFPLIREIKDSNKSVIYLALQKFAKFFAKKIEAFWDSKATSIKSLASDINERRLYCMDEGDLTGTVIEFLPQEFKHKSDIANIINYPDRALGYLSWILNYLVFGIELYLLVRHSFAGPWMSEEEKSVGFSERFRTQWQHRKFALLNSFLFGTVNLVCFYIQNLTYLNIMLSAGAFIFLLGTYIWQFFEEEAKFRALNLKYANEIARLQKLIDAETDEKIKANRILKLNDLVKIKKEQELEWEYKKYHIKNSMAFCLGLICAIAIMACCLISAVAPYALIVKAVGQALFFIVTLAYAAISEGIENKKAKHKMQDVAFTFNVKKEQFLQHPENDNTKKLLYLELCQLATKTEHQKKIIRYQRINLLNTIIVDGIFPSLAFISLVFLPTGFGFAGLAIGISLALFLKFIIRQFNPATDAIPVAEFNEAEFNNILQLQNPKLQDFSQASNKSKVALNYYQAENHSTFFQSSNESSFDDDYVYVGLGTPTPEPLRDEEEEVVRPRSRSFDSGVFVNADNSFSRQASDDSGIGEEIHDGESPKVK